MYLGIDVGGTKTYLATLDDNGVIIDSVKFPTDKDYDQFVRDLDQNLKQLNLESEYSVSAGIAGQLDRKAGIVHALGNLPWVDKPIGPDISKLVGGRPVLIENDARLAGLSEAQLIKDKYNRVLFLTVSTGIGGALIIDGKIVRALEDTEMGKMPLLYEGSIQNWEDFAGGRSVVSRFGKKAYEITDPGQWRQIGDTIAYGLAICCSALTPQAIVLGGSIGAHADKYSAGVMEYLRQQLHPVIKQPEVILAAKRADDAVIYGCYDLAKQVYTHATDN